MSTNKKNKTVAKKLDNENRLDNNMLEHNTSQLINKINKSIHLFNRKRKHETLHIHPTQI